MSGLTRRRALKLALASLTPGYQPIDPHVHVWKHDPQFPFAPGANPPARDATPEMLLQLMRANGVEKTVLIQVIHYRYANRYLSSILKQYPDLFRGVCRVDPLDPAAPDRLSELCQEQGFQGVRLSPAADASGDWIRGPLMRPLWRRCDELQIPMTLLTSITRMPDVQTLVESFPSLTVVIDHMADCPADRLDQLEMLAALARYPKVFVKVSHTWTLSKQPYPWLDSQRLVKRLYDAFGPHRLMWGTDWPICETKASYRQTLNVVRDDMTFLNDGDKEWILRKTVERVWKF